MHIIPPDIMEVTLRDGSYVIDFQFTAKDTATLVSALEGAGFRWIEIGHGLGLNANDSGQRRAAASDEAHIEAAAQAAKDAQWGAFFIPGLGRADDLRLAAKYGMDFIRIGTNVNESERARPFIELAKELGMMVCYNAMKSYAVSPSDFAKVAKQTADWGADLVYIVDSAGTMLPEDVAAFFKAIQAETPVPLGFHGHDNLSMGMANTLQAIESGAVMVDSSLRGMGRSAGNVISEALVAIMQRRGRAQHIDLKATMDISSGFIAPLVPGRGIDTMAIIAGYAGFHSSFTDKVKIYAEKHQIDVRDLIVRLCEQNRFNAPDDLLETLSLAIASEQQTKTLHIPAFELRHSEGETGLSLAELLAQMYSDAQKYRSYSVLNIVISQTLEDTYQVSSHIHNTRTHTIGSVTISTETQLVEVLQTVDGQVDLVFLDIDTRRIFGPQMSAATAQDLLKQSQLLVYSDSRVWAEAVKNQVVTLLQQQVQSMPIVIAGNHPRSRLLSVMLLDYGAEVTILARDDSANEEEATTHFSQAIYPEIHYLSAAQATLALEKARVVVVWPEGAKRFGVDLAARLQTGTYLIDAGIGSISEDGLAVAQERGALAIRVNIWHTLAGRLLTAHSSVQGQAAWDSINGVALVSGGALGEHGAVIVDDVHYPTRIIGIADGKGGVLRLNSEFSQAIQKITEYIHQQRIKPQV